MKNILLILICFFLFTQLSYTQTRNTLWLGGLSQTSQGWGRTPEDLEQYYNYDLFNVISLQGLDNTTYQPDLGIYGAAANIDIGNYPNVLGLGHDSGGLVLRAMANGSNNLTAIVLDGVPNLGSSAIGFAINSDGSDGETQAEFLIQGIKAIKADENCEDCDLVGSFEFWINDMKANKELLSEMTSNSPVINSLNQPENMPQIPYVVFWGSMEELSITTLMSSRFFPATGDADQFTKCYADALSRAREDANKEFAYSAIDNLSGFFNKAIGFVSKFFGDNPLSSPLQIIQSTAAFIETQREEITSQLEAIRKRDQELARILRCELANQLLATEWQFALAENGTFITEEVANVPILDCLDCFDFDGEESWDDNYTSNCIDTDCINGVETVTVLIPESNDGLLNRSEQLLSGAAATYHLENTNHFQETKLENDFSDKIQELFDGGAGAAFVVNKQ